MRTARYRKAIIYAPKLLLIVRFIHAISDWVKRADDDFAQQSASRAKCQIAEIPAHQWNVLHRVGKAVAHLNFVEDRRRKNAGLVYRHNVLPAAEPLGQQITQN